MAVESILSETYFGSSVPQYALFFAIVGLGAVVGRSLGVVYQRRLKKKARRTETELDDIILYALGRPVVLLGVVIGAALGRGVLTPVEPLRSALNASVEIPVILTIAWVAVRLTDGVINSYIGEYADRTESKLDDELVPIVNRVANIAIVSITLLVALDSIGYDVTTVIASLGIGGVAVAFASRKTAADIFGGAHILTTKPFLVDDIVEIDGTAGTVEEIGLRTTRIRDFDGRIVTFPNSAIADSEVKNITSEPTRRVKMFIGLTYETSPDRMSDALDLITERINRVDGIDTERTGAWFWEYGETSMRIRIEYFIEDLDRWKDIRDTVNRDLQTALDEAGYEIGLPTRTVRLDDGEMESVQLP